VQAQADPHGPAEGAAVEVFLVALPVAANAARSRTVSSCPRAHRVGASASTIARRSSKRSSQTLQRYS